MIGKRLRTSAGDLLMKQCVLRWRRHWKRFEIKTQACMLCSKVAKSPVHNCWIQPLLLLAIPLLRPQFHVVDVVKNK